MNRSVSTDALRIVHLPARTPYVRKLRAPDVHIVNDSEVDGTVVPTDVTASWLLDQRPLSWFDVLHLHHIEFEDPPSLERLLDACADDDVRVVCTVHDLHAIFTSDSELHQRLRTLAAGDTAWVCLTPGSRVELARVLGREVDATVIPHGYVVDPDTPAERPPSPATRAPRSLLYGSVRPNRDQLSAVVNWSLSTTDPESRLHLLVRGFSPVDFRTPGSIVPQLLDATRADSRITTTMRPHPTDQEVVDAALAADALILPYLWASHSGQLELAFDLDLVPICSTVGHLPEQADLHKGLVTEPEWFDWSDGNPYLFGERFVAALERATHRIAEGARQPNRTFTEYRRAEHHEVLASYRRVYST